MCIQNNLRYKALIEAGMPASIEFYYYAFNDTYQVIVMNVPYWGRMTRHSVQSPERAFDSMFICLENMYGPTH